MLDQIGVALDLANQVGLVAAGVKISMPNLPIIVGAYRIVSLADMYGNMDVLGKTFDGQVYCRDRVPHFFIARWGQVGLIDLDVLTTRFGQPDEVPLEQLRRIKHHPRWIVVMLIVGHSSKKMRTRHRDLYGFTGVS